jgi:alpha,alpha-trehalase
MANLKTFEHPGGLAMSNVVTGVQWDEPYGWAPTNMIAVEGMRRYGFKEDADRVSVNFLGTIVENFRRDNTIREKYNVLTRSTDAQVAVGYAENAIGFGWTNATFEVFWNQLSPAQQAQVMNAKPAAPKAKAKAAGKGSAQ